MIARRDYKVPGGKLLRAEVEVEAGCVVAASVQGDFFAFPEEEWLSLRTTNSIERLN